MHTPSQFVADEVVAEFGVDPGRVRVVYHGVPPLARPGSRRAGPPRRFPTGCRRYVLAVGTVEPRKDYPALVRAFDRDRRGPSRRGAGHRRRRRVGGGRLADARGGVAGAGTGSCGSATSTTTALGGGAAPAPRCWPSRRCTRGSGSRRSRRWRPGCPWWRRRRARCPRWSGTGPCWCPRRRRRPGRRARLACSRRRAGRRRAGRHGHGPGRRASRGRRARTGLADAVPRRGRAPRGAARTRRPGGPRGLRAPGAVAEQLRRPVPGGIGTYVRGLLQGPGPTMAIADRGRAAGLTLYARRPPRPAPTRSRPRPSAFARRRCPGRCSPGPGTAAGAAPPAFDVVHAVSLRPPWSTAPRPAGGDGPRRGLAHRPRALPGRGRRWHEAALRRALAPRRSTSSCPSRARSPTSSTAAGADPRDDRRSSRWAPTTSRRPTTTAAAARLGAPRRARSSCCRSGPSSPARTWPGCSRPTRDRPQPAARAAGRWWSSARRDGARIAPHSAGWCSAGTVSGHQLAALYARGPTPRLRAVGRGIRACHPVEAMRSARRWWRAPCRAPGAPRSRSTPRRRRDRRGDRPWSQSTTSSRADLVRRGTDRTSGLTWSSIARRHLAVWRAAARDRGRDSWLTDSLRLSLDVSAVPARPVGAGRYIVELARSLARRSDLDVAALARVARTAARWHGLGTDRLAWTVGAGPRDRCVWPGSRCGCRPLVDHAGVDVHHGPHYTMPERARVPRVVTVHDLTFFDHPEWHERRKVARVPASHPPWPPGGRAVVVCASRCTADELARWCQVGRRVVVAPHGVDHARFRPDEPSPGATTPSLPGRRLGSWTGGPTSVRGHARAPQGRARPGAAFDRRRRHAVPTLLLVLAGRPRLGRRRGREGHRLPRGPAPRVVRTGYVPDEAVPALLRAAAAVAYPSARGGLRPPRPRGAGLRRAPRDDRGHRHGGGRRRRGRAGPAGRVAEPRRRARRRSSRRTPDVGRAPARRGLEIGRRATPGTASAAPSRRGLPDGAAHDDRARRRARFARQSHR